MAVRPKPVVLAILDGWGVAPPSRGNAIAMANTPVFDELIRVYPTTVLQAAGDAVGLPYGEMGNSEVGHLSLGTGRIIYQDLPRIMKAVSDGSFFTNEVLLQAMDQVKKMKTTLHLIGLLSSGGVHSSNEHAHAVVELAAKHGLEKVAVHAILDGRDTARDSGKGFIQKLQTVMTKLKLGRIATVAGRFYAMDRDNRWDRIEKAYRAMAQGVGVKAHDPIKAIEQSYRQGIYDEQVVPTVITAGKEKPLLVGPGDAVIFFNFRSDRARQLTEAFVLPGFHHFKRDYLADLFFVTMTEYEKDVPVAVAFPPQTVEHSLAKVLSDQGLRQLHVAETEKYAHVTFFFNGGREEAWPGEERVLIPSPMVASYDQTPRMSAVEITERLLRELNTGHYDFAVVNFANADMVGHSGNIEATVQAIEVLDQSLGQIVTDVTGIDGVVAITADHGNAEDKIDPQTGRLNKEHTANPVPFLLIGNQWRSRPGLTAGRDLSTLPASGVLADVAPTILELMRLPKPQDMTGRSLVSLLTRRRD